MRNKTRILVTGAGGFIGHHLVDRLKAEGYWVRGVDLKHPQYETSKADEFEILDLRRFEDCLLAARGGIDQIYNLAADMGGIGFITANHAQLARNNILINAHMLEAARGQNAGRFLVFFFSLRLSAIKTAGHGSDAAERGRRLSR